MNRYDNWKLASPIREYDADPNCDKCDGTGWIEEDADPDNGHECACTTREANMRRAMDRAEEDYYGRYGHE